MTSIIAVSSGRKHDNIDIIGNGALWSVCETGPN